MCPVGISLELGFGQGPGGSEAAAHAALMGLRFHRRSEPVLFRRCLPGMATLEMVNRIRTAIMENWDWLRMFDHFFKDFQLHPSEMGELNGNIYIYTYIIMGIL